RGVDEFELIARYFAPLAAGEPGALGLADDAAVLAMPPGRHLVVTADMLVEGVHFRADDPPDSLGIKALGVNLSDLAAMGAEPRAYLLALALPAAWPETRRQPWLASFAEGLRTMQREFAIPLAGGDTVATPGPLSLAITAIGTAPEGGTLRRAGGRPGDVVWVSGTIGDGALGLRVLNGDHLLDDADLVATLVDRYRRPRPRLALGRALTGIAHACADVSDGLIADLRHICQASQVSAVVEAERVPLSAAARAAVRRDPRLWTTVLTGGDDYELVFIAAAADSERVQRAAADTATAVSAIGRLFDAPATEAGSVGVLAGDGRRFEPEDDGWKHF
ncbi:MAG TPA: thiamine-phosphate kinase, partial [Rhodospirillales bacterium]|nr:thiamine-phosphate kinase [Rhodospirillales bacterium]